MSYWNVVGIETSSVPGSMDLRRLWEIFHLRSSSQINQRQVGGNDPAPLWETRQVRRRDGLCENV